MNDLLYNVEAVFDTQNGYLSEHKMGYYNIPLYQRGYKWNSAQVLKLLTDIDKFKLKEGKFYCVQNITLVPKAEGYFNIVDGQQRLTTLTLILACLGDYGLIKHVVRFPNNSVREMTNKFINDYITSDNDLIKFQNWNELIRQYEYFDHQDVYFIYNAYMEINKWLDKKSKDEKEVFRTKLLKNVKFIVNNIKDQNEVKIFGNLNSKRIYLDGADLIRAILITRVTEEDSEAGGNAFKDIIVRNERRVRIGWILDELNNWWSQKEIFEYFIKWSKYYARGDVNFSIETHPINLLYHLFAKTEGFDLSLEVIEEYNSARQLYNNILKVNSILQDWYNDKEIYHYLGFLFNQGSLNFKIVWDKWHSQEMTRDKFKLWLISNIQEVIFDKRSIQETFFDGKNWFEGDNPTLVQILLLLDIIEANKKSKDRLKPISFLKSDNDLEHIHPQTPRDIDTESNWKKLIEFIEFIKKYDESLKENSILNAFNPENISETGKVELLAFLGEYQRKINTHSIGNIVLLYDRLNRSLGNKPYAYKRRRVMESFNDGIYIQPHTLKVFSRYFAMDDDTVDALYWRNEDIIANEKSIKQTLEKFFNR